MELFYWTIEPQLSASHLAHEQGCGTHLLSYGSHVLMGKNIITSTMHLDHNCGMDPILLANGPTFDTMFDEYILELDDVAGHHLFFPPIDHCTETVLTIPFRVRIVQCFRSKVPTLTAAHFAPDPSVHEVDHALVDLRNDLLLHLAQDHERNR